MPGGRLTHDDRRSIAEGLAEGLPYSTIAKRIGRPTSTVTREVARNGGPGHYRPDRAQEATRRRASRSAPAAPPTALNGRADVLRFEEDFVAMQVATGMPRMPARVLACLLTDTTASLTAADLVHRLRVSPASISKAVGYLEAQELVRRERDTAGRRERYVLGSDLWHRSLLASGQRNTALAEGARRTAAILGSDTPVGVRLTEAADFLDRIGQEIIQAVERWWQGRPEREPGPADDSSTRRVVDP
jgi:Helix-turn-helix domain/MarR family